MSTPEINVNMLCPSVVGLGSHDTVPSIKPARYFTWRADRRPTVGRTTERRLASISRYRGRRESRRWNARQRLSNRHLAGSRLHRRTLLGNLPETTATRLVPGRRCHTGCRNCHLSLFVPGKGANSPRGFWRLSGDWVYTEDAVGQRCWSRVMLGDYTCSSS